MWSIFPLFTDNPNFWALEQALIQLWQPRLNTPFIYQFFNCRKGLIVQRPFSSTRQFGTFSLWRKLRWASTPQRVRATFYSKRFYDRTLLLIQHLGPNSLKRFQMEKRIRSHEFGLHGCYTLFASLPPTWVNPSDPTPSMPSTELSNSGKGNESLAASLYELHGCYHLHGPLTYANCSNTISLR